MTDINKNLKDNNIEIPEATKPIANYSPYIKSGNLIFVSGQIPLVKGEIVCQGKVGIDVSIDFAKEAARICMLNSLGVLNVALNNNLLSIKKCLKITVFINSNDTFVDQPSVADGASDLLNSVLYPNGQHSRSAVSVNALPKNSTVEVDSIFEIFLEK